MYRRVQLDSLLRPKDVILRVFTNSSPVPRAQGCNIRLTSAASWVCSHFGEGEERREGTRCSCVGHVTVGLDDSKENGTALVRSSQFQETEPRKVEI